MSTVRSAAAAMAYRAPKTIFGFFAILMGILASGVVFAVGILARYRELHYLILPILIFVGVVFVLTLVGLFLTAWKDPTKLMLSIANRNVRFL